MEFDSIYSDNATNNQTLDKLNPALAELGPAQPQLVYVFINWLWYYFTQLQLYACISWSLPIWAAGYNTVCHNAKTLVS